MHLRVLETGVDMAESYTERYRDPKGREVIRADVVAPPRGQRDDALVCADVLDRLRLEGIDTSRIAAEVHLGEVFLMGTVESRALRARIDSIASLVGGVAVVHNMLRVSTAHP